MQVMTLPLAALALLDAANAPAPPPATGPQAVIREIQSFTPPERQCRDGALQTNTEQSRQPQYERRPAAPGMGQIIYAVDRRVDGCSVILVRDILIGPSGQFQLTPEELAEFRSRR